MKTLINVLTGLIVCSFIIYVLVTNLINHYEEKNQVIIFVFLFFKIVGFTWFVLRLLVELKTQKKSKTHKT